MSIITLGTIDKKLLWPLIYSISCIAYNIYLIYSEYNTVTLYIDSFGGSIGQIMTIFVNCAFKYRGIAKYKKSIKRQYFKDFVFLVLIDVFYMISDLFSIIYGEEGENSNSSRELYINDAIKIIFLTIVTIFILKYKYYKHHIISITAIVFLSIIIDILLENFTHTSTFVVLDSIIFILADSLIYS